MRQPSFLSSSPRHAGQKAAQLAKGAAWTLTLQDAQSFTLFRIGTIPCCSLYYLPTTASHYNSSASHFTETKNKKQKKNSLAKKNLS